MRRISAAIMALCLPVLAWGQVNTLPSAPHILVKGHAQGEYVPDRFTIHLDIDVVNKSPDLARRKVEKHIKAIFAALAASGALPKLTRASSLGIGPDYEYENDQRVFKGTQVSRTVHATFDSLDKLRGFIAHLHTDKEVRISSMDVARSDIATIRMRLRRRAIENSKQAAAQLAKAYGMRLNGIYSVSDVAPDFAYGVQAGSWTGSNSNQTLGAVAVTANASPPKRVAFIPPPPSGHVAPSLRAGTIEVQMNT